MVMRYLPLQPTDRAAMLADVGLTQQDQLFDALPAVPREKAKAAVVDGLPPHQPEWEVESHFAALAAKNSVPGARYSHGARPLSSFLGAGAYRHHVPATVDYLIQRGEFLTSYTPYQPEISQGTLQYLFEFQTQVATLFGMDVANASLYDGATAMAEAIMMAVRLTGRSKVVISGHVHPHYVQVAKTYGAMMNFEVIALPPVLTSDPEEPGLLEALGSPASSSSTGDGDGADLGIEPKEIACVVSQNPGFLGHVYGCHPLIKAVHAVGAMHITVVTEVVSLGLLQAPGEVIDGHGTDIVVGEGQSLGNPLTYGGPHLGLFATRQVHKRAMPGRLVGESIDRDGRRGFILTLVAREQHIRREKATSNICTNAGLCSLAFSIHLSLLGGRGLYGLARLNHQRARELMEALRNLSFPYKIVPSAYFNEFALELPFPAAPCVAYLAARSTHGVIPGLAVSQLYPHHQGCERLLLMAVTELTTAKDIDELIKSLNAYAKGGE